jgi:hypothetical protein
VRSRGDVDLLQLRGARENSLRGVDLVSASGILRLVGPPGRRRARASHLRMIIVSGPSWWSTTD